MSTAKMLTAKMLTNEMLTDKMSTFLTPSDSPPQGLVPTTNVRW
jgi:hypothetical protein